VVKDTTPRGLLRHQTEKISGKYFVQIKRRITMNHVDSMSIEELGYDPSLPVFVTEETVIDSDIAEIAGEVNKEYGE
jgi:hypothetical protein